MWATASTLEASGRGIIKLLTLKLIDRSKQEGQQAIIFKELHLQKAQLNRLQAEADRHAFRGQRVTVLENKPGQVQLEVGRIEEEVKR